MGWLEDLFRGNGGYNPGQGKTGQINLDVVVPKGADRYAAWSREAPPRSVPLPSLSSLNVADTDIRTPNLTAGQPLYPSTLGQGVSTLPTSSVNGRLI